MSRVSPGLDTNLGRLDVDADCDALVLVEELDEVDEKVLLRSIPRLTITNKSSRNFFDDASVKPVLSYRDS
jgi:hypothetical protein